MKLAKYSFGIGDRFGHQGKYQLEALKKAWEKGVEVTPVWNKSYREHTIVHTSPTDVRVEADESIKSLGWTNPYLVDADHINLNTVESFVEVSDFFTLDVAAYIGKEADAAEVDAFIAKHQKYIGQLQIPGIAEPFDTSEAHVKEIVSNFYIATKEAAGIYEYIVDKKGKGNFITEVSMDEVEVPQTPVEMFFILCLLSDFGVPAQTIAPKFTGRFNKGVDYEGDIAAFTKEFEEDLLVIDYAVAEFGFPTELKLSVHSGSDKFSIYPIMGDIIKKYDKGLHVKTAGTTWLEEVIGLAVAGGSGLDIAKEVYANALGRMEELCGPYADVIDIKEDQLPSVEEVNSWDSNKFANTLRHIPGHPDYNSNFRQLIHVGYKVAAEMGSKYLSAIEANAEIVGHEVKTNIYDRHLVRLFNL